MTPQLSDEMAAVPDNPIIIIGGGLGGVAAAASLLAAGRCVLLLEGSGRFGGRIRTAWSEAAPGVAVDLGGVSTRCCAAESKSAERVKGLSLRASARAPSDTFSLTTL